MQVNPMQRCGIGSLTLEQVEMLTGIHRQVHIKLADLTAQMRGILDNTPEGRLTPPEITQQGIELFALCRKRETASELPGKRGDKRAKAIDALVKSPDYADHWATFWSVLLVGRRTREEPDGKPHLSIPHQIVENLVLTGLHTVAVHHQA